MRGGNDEQHKNWKGKILKRWIRIIRHGGLGHQVQGSGRFYILPKIHKKGNPGRPIVSSNSHCQTERISKVVDYHINPLVSTLDSHI